MSWLLAIGVVVGVALLVLPAWRAWWRIGESNPLHRGLRALETEGCVGCHRATDGRWRWRADDRPPSSLEVVRNAIRVGRPATIGLGPAMPPGTVGLGSRLESRLVLAVGATSGLVGVPDEPELQVGLEIARDAGCFGCHGPFGAGGVPAPGTVAGEVPGWFGSRFEDREGETARIRRAVLEGDRQSVLPWAGGRGARLAMPSYAGVLDSTEIELLVRYVEWLRHESAYVDPAR